MLDAARAAGMPVTTRGAGTSCAGNAVGPGPGARHLAAPRTGSSRSIREARTAVVEPGVVQASLQRAAAPYGLRFGPDPSTHTRCTIGGMIGNNACGPRALGLRHDRQQRGRPRGGDRVGRAARAGRPRPHPDLRRACTRCGRSSAQNLGTIRTEFGTFGRQVSGYSLEHLLPERRFDLAKFVAGTEGTLAVILNATVRLVADAPHKIMVALGYPSMADAADATPALLEFSPTAVEGLGRPAGRGRPPAAR